MVIDGTASARPTNAAWRPPRRAKLRGMLFSALTLAAPHQAKFVLPVVANVSTTVNSFVAVPPHLAYEPIIREAAAIHGVDVTLIRSVMQAESAFDPSAVSRAGAMGLMQLMPDTAEAFGVVNPFDPRENIMAGTRLLKELLTQYQRQYPADARRLQRRLGRRGPLRRARAAVQGNEELREENHRPDRRRARVRRRLIAKLHLRDSDIWLSAIGCRVALK